MADLIRGNKELSAWLTRLDDLAIVASVAVSEQQRLCIETLLHLVDAKPASVSSIAWATPDRQRLAALLSLEAWDAAAFLFVPQNACIMASRGLDDRWFVTLILPDGAQECTNTGKSLALAMIAALAMALTEHHMPGRHDVPAMPFFTGNTAPYI